MDENADYIKFIYDIIILNFIENKKKFPVANFIKLYLHDLMQEYFSYDKENNFIEDTAQYLMYYLPGLHQIQDKRLITYKVNVYELFPFRIEISGQASLWRPSVLIYYKNELIGDGLPSKKCLDFIVYLLQHAEDFIKLDKLIQLKMMEQEANVVE